MNALCIGSRRVFAGGRLESLWLPLPFLSAPEIGFCEIDDLVGPTAHDRLHHVEREALRHLDVDRGRHGEFCPADDRVDENRAVMREGRADTVLDLGGVFYPNTANTDRFGHCREIWMLELGSKIEEARGLLLKLDETECAVVEHHDLGRKAMLHERQQVAHQHGEAPVA